MLPKYTLSKGERNLGTLSGTSPLGLTHHELGQGIFQVRYVRVSFVTVQNLVTLALSQHPTMSHTG